MEKPKRIISPEVLRKDRIPPGQSVYDDLPILHEGIIPNIKLAEWTIETSGLVKNPLRLSLNDLVLLPQIELFCDVHCVEGWSKLDTSWVGVWAGTLADKTMIDPKARFVIIHAAGGFTTNLPLKDFLREDVILAMVKDGDVLEAEHGGPVRLIVPHLYFWKSAKWVTGIEFVEKDQPGFWEKAGYHNHGDPWIEERFSPERARQKNKA
ncbi:MAG: sulfite oxidase-like oxidoreductase [Dehalococcoidales bacterium]|jgi:DMSO/TMAO reductase YedYZ molybdopterin-dependent catalytic subunit|nr:sulfite oxidase-like oxidoreductase [Dehalococcoidales bacterium]MDX9985873.1 sulfite oxidase-like oxidoreductase [Dehalococcoidales bacterium]